MTPEYILRKSLCRPAHCGHHVADNATEAQKLDAHRADVRSAESEIENMMYAPEYAEPGYTSPDKAVLFANWNYFPRGIDSVLERYGYAIEWSDEWATCEGCNRAVRTSPDSYGWQPSYALVNDCEIVCADCLASDAADYLESLENRPRTALNNPTIDPTQYGYVKLESDFESGWHPGQTDDPEEIFARLSGKYSRLLFQIDSVGQFDIRFSIWYHPEDN